MSNRRFAAAARRKTSLRVTAATRRLGFMIKRWQMQTQKYRLQIYVKTIILNTHGQETAQQ
jgi:hypothetical protein